MDSYYVNLNYICNERCTFCASDRTNNIRIPGRRIPEVTLEELRSFLHDNPVEYEIPVLLAGGEPTLHRDFLAIVELFHAYSHDISVFTNGLKLVDESFAEAMIRAGVSCVKIPLFGASPMAHEAVTQVRGSFDKTLKALSVLDKLKQSHDFELQVRLLTSRQSYQHNPDIIRLLHRRKLRVDTFTLNRLILSENAQSTDSTISWADAASSINESMRLALDYGYNVVFSAIPWCVFTNANAELVSQEFVKRGVSRREAGRMHYLDPLMASGFSSQPTERDRPGLPAICHSCRYSPFCGRVENWYTERFGTAGLRAM